MEKTLRDIFEYVYAYKWHFVALKPTSNGRVYVKASHLFKKPYGESTFDGYYSASYVNALCNEYFSKSFREYIRTNEPKLNKFIKPTLKNK